MALLAYALWPTWERTQVSEEFAEMLDASRLYLQYLFSGIKTNHERLQWRRARSNVQASVDRVISEPGITALKRDTLLSMLASSHSLMLAVAGHRSRHERARLAAKANGCAPNVHTRRRFHALFFNRRFKGLAPRKRKSAAIARRPPAVSERPARRPGGRWRLFLDRNRQAHRELEYSARASHAIRSERSKLNIARLLTRAALRAKFVLLDLQRELPFVMPGNPAPGHQIEQTLFIQLGRPTDRDL